jgi:hypothetical protein
MPRIVLEVGEGTDHVGFDHVFIKSTGWVCGYDDDDRDERVFYPPHRVRRVVGDVTHHSSHGRV